MTCIAWDGKTLAADKRMSFSCEFATVTKLHRIDGCLVGWAGDAAIGRAMIAWARDGFNIDAFPSAQRDRSNNGSLMVIRPNGEINHYGVEPYPMIIEDKHYTIGSGSPFAMTAMYLGCDARRAVEVACALDIGCGNGIDTLTLG
jgi:20S proteasome alpha/beta subunit